MTALADQLEQPTPGVVILFVGLEMVRQIGNAIAEQRDLDFRRTGVFFVLPEVCDNLLFPLGVKRHVSDSSFLLSFLSKIVANGDYPTQRLRVNFFWFPPGQDAVDRPSPVGDFGKLPLARNLSIGKPSC
jgi:hypothetical protein